MPSMKFTKKNRYNAAPLCPCGKSNKDGKFVPFEINGTPSKKYGHCHSCGKTFHPAEYKEIKNYKPIQKSVHQNAKSVPLSEMTKTLNNYYKNNFILWLSSIFPEDFNKAIKRYRVGTLIDHCTLFWYIDIKGQVRTGKRIKYNSLTGKRDKKVPIYNLFTKENGYSLCLYGEHLLKQNFHKTIALVESEKTSIVGSILFPQYMWLATGGANSLTIGKAQVLKYKDAIYIPDCDIAGNNSIIKVSNILKKVKSNFSILDSFSKNFNQGEDIVDLLFKNQNTIINN